MSAVRGITGSRVRACGLSERIAYKFDTLFSSPSHNSEAIKAVQKSLAKADSTAADSKSEP